MGSHSDTCHPAEVRIPPLPPTEAGTRFSDPVWSQGWVDLRYVKVDRLGIEPATCQSQVQHPIYRSATTQHRSTIQPVSLYTAHKNRVVTAYTKPYNLCHAISQ